MHKSKRRAAPFHYTLYACETSNGNELFRLEEFNCLRVCAKRNSRVFLQSLGRVYYNNIFYGEIPVVLTHVVCFYSALVITKFVEKYDRNTGKIARETDETGEKKTIRWKRRIPHAVDSSLSSCLKSIQFFDDSKEITAFSVWLYFSSYFPRTSYQVKIAISLFNFAFFVDKSTDTRVLYGEKHISRRAKQNGFRITWLTTFRIVCSSKTNFA